MAATPTLAASGSWTDFSAAADKTVSPSAAITVGHRAFLCLSTTVDGGVNPGAASWGGIVSLTDSVGNTWARDNYSPPVDGTNSQCTQETWSCYVATQIPTSGYTLHVTPDSRGLSAYWCFLDVDGLDEDGGVSSPADQVVRAAVNFSTSWSSGATGTTGQDAEWLLGVFGVGSVNFGTNNWITPQTVSPTWNVLHTVDGTAPGSQRGLCVVERSVAAAGTFTLAGTANSSSTGGLHLTTYKIATAGGGGSDWPPADAPAGPALSVTVNPQRLA